jgi:ubiquinone/menaquinone biosynthesis C-methylase UbiE
MTNHSKTVGAFFDDKWALYQKAIRGNVLCHEEMFGTLDRFLTEAFGQRAFSFADFGCGDSSAVLDVLRNKNLNHYIGVDAASDLIRRAEETLEPLQCKKTLLCEDMASAIDSIEFTSDVIFCSYSLHHLPPGQKSAFINNCYNRLNIPGYFIMIDGVRTEGETRDEWLQRLEHRFLTLVPGFTAEDTAEIMQHPRASDHPETISTFRTIAQHSPWRSFEIQFERDDFLAFLLFSK